VHKVTKETYMLFLFWIGLEPLGAFQSIEQKANRGRLNRIICKRISSRTEKEGRVGHSPLTNIRKVNYEKNE